MDSVKIPVVNKLPIVDDKLRFLRVRDKSEVGEIKVLLNEPISGVRIDEMAYANHRCRAYRKLVRLIDPRGFDVYVTPDNLIELLNSTTVENGIIQGDCVYSPYGVVSKVYVVDSKEYTELLERNKSLLQFRDTKLQVGNVIGSGQHVFIWLGRHNLYAEVYELSYNGYRVYSWAYNQYDIEECFRAEGIKGYESIYSDVKKEVELYCDAMNQYLSGELGVDCESAKLHFNNYLRSHNVVRHKVLLGEYSCVLEIDVVDGKTVYSLSAKKSLSRRNFERFIMESESDYRKALGLEDHGNLGIELFYKSDVLQPKLMNHAPYFNRRILYTSGLESWGLSDYKDIRAGTAVGNEKVVFKFSYDEDIREKVKKSILENNGELKVFDTFPLEV